MDSANPPPHETGIPQEYQTNKYIPRGGHSAYVASLYREQPNHGDPFHPMSSSSSDEDGQTGVTNSCSCGGHDHAHVFDAQFGCLPIETAKRHFKQYTNLTHDLDSLTCHPSKRDTIDSPHQDEVDELSALRRPPSKRYNQRRGRDANITFDQWCQEKLEGEIEREAERKRLAIAELALQIRRRVDAQQEYANWKYEKAQLARKHTEEERERQQDAESKQLTPEELAEQKREREETFEEWRRAKDRARIAKLQQQQYEKRQRAQSERLTQSEKRKRADESFHAWKTGLGKTKSAKKAEQVDSTEKQREETAAAKAERELKAKKEYANWSVKKNQDLRKSLKRESWKMKMESDQKLKRAQEVAATQPQREERLQTHFRALIIERTKREEEETRAARVAHFETWAKKANPVAYGTLPRPKTTFKWCLPHTT